MLIFHKKIFQFYSGTTSKKSIEANINELVTTIIWETQIKWWSASINLGLVNICYYSIRITIEAYTNLKQILEKNLGKKWNAENLRIEFQQRWVKLKCSVNKRVVLLQYYTNLPY